MSSITIINGTNENVRIAVFKKPYKQATFNTIAWRIVAPPQGGLTRVPVPTNYEVFVNYSFIANERNDPNGGNQTVKLPIDSTTGRFIVNSSRTNDGQDMVASIEQSYTELVLNEMRIENQAGFGVWGHITMDGDDVYPPRVISPGRVLLEDLRTPLYLAVVDLFISQGDRLVQEEISMTPVSVLIGSTVTVTGSQFDGYSIR